MERMGMRVTLADNGLNAVNICKTKKFDIIFMDIQMPIMDGWRPRAACENRKRTKTFGRPPLWP